MLTIINHGVQMKVYNFNKKHRNMCSQIKKAFHKSTFYKKSGVILPNFLCTYIELVTRIYLSITSVYLFNNDHSYEFDWHL